MTPEEIVPTKKDVIQKILALITMVYQPNSGLALHVEAGLFKLTLGELHGLLLMIETSK